MILMTILCVYFHGKKIKNGFIESEGIREVNDIINHKQ